MKKKVIAAASAGVLALLGVLVLVVWAQGANDRAFEGAKLVPVVRLTDDVKVNTSSAELTSKTEVVKLPEAAVPVGAVTSLDQVTGLSTNASVQKGEMLLKSRMVAVGERGKGSTNVPKGYQEITVSLDAQHAVGGVVKAGDKVGLIATFDSGSKDGKFGNLILHDVVVTKVGGLTDAKDVTANLYTVAVKTLDSEKIAFAADFGRVWLTRQNPDTDKTGEGLVTTDGFLK